MLIAGFFNLLQFCLRPRIFKPEPKQAICSKPSQQEQQATNGSAPLGGLLNNLRAP